MKIKKYTHIIWDWNGTMLDDVELSRNIINNILIRNNHSTLSIVEYKNIFTVPVRKYYEKVGLVKSDEDFRILGREWIDEYEKRKYECPLFNDLREVLDHFKNQNVGQSILSSYKQDTLEEFVDHYKLTGYFERIFGNDNVYGTCKIDRGKELLNKLNGNGENVLLIGDTTHDFEVADAIGIDCVLVARGHQSHSVLANTDTKIVNSLRDIIRLS